MPYQVEAELRIVRDEKHEDRDRSCGHANAQCEAQGRTFADYWAGRPAVSVSALTIPSISPATTSSRLLGSRMKLIAHPMRATRGIIPFTIAI
jgi:hypothetical protein